MQSVMNHAFSMIPKAEIPRSAFDRSHGHKTTGNAGYLIPFLVDHALPGDTFRLNTHLLMRLTTPIVPIMDNLFLETFYFAVPYRLVWENWVRLCGERPSPTDDIDYLVPQIELGTSQTAQSLSDYMGIPPSSTEDYSVSALPFRAYNLIYNEWFRSQDLIDSAKVDLGDGPDDPADYTIKRRTKRHDYFTSCLPTPQKGDPVTIGLTGVTEAPVIGSGDGLRWDDGTNEGYFYYDNFLPGIRPAQSNATILATGSQKAGGDPDVNYKTLGVAGADSGLVAQLQGEELITTVNSLRESFQVQRLLERDQRGGTRYTEIIRSHFGVVSPDARLQRPELLGMSTHRVQITPVQQTGETGTTPQGNLAAYGVATGSNSGFSKSFTEHSVVIGIMCLRADLTYQQGINRHWTKRERYDFYWPALAHLGEQAVLNSEIVADHVVPTDVFGYQERYAEYRYFPSQISGQFRSTFATPLDQWHLSQELATTVSLNSDFIEENPPMDRVLAVGSAPDFLFDSYLDYKCIRPMPTFSVPGLIDHL